MTRMNMNKILGNYRGKDTAICPLCEEGKGDTEHYFQCPKVRLLRNVWAVEVGDLTSKEVVKMKDVSKFMEKVEIMIDPKQEKFF